MASNFEERVVKIKRISKTTKGGRMMRFSALVVIGDKKGTVGFGMGKSMEVPDAIKKAIKNANNNLFKIKQTKKGSVFHNVIGHHGAAKVMLLPAPEGTGIIAGGPVRAVVELAGFTDIYTKSRGSNSPMNVIRATINGLTQQLTPSEIAKLRDKELKDL
nr:30S ribosomal protein S5 [Ureaplasma canigenitalium]